MFLEVNRYAINLYHLVVCPYYCTNCDSNAKCLSCPSSRYLSSDKCLCKTRYWDDQTSLDC